MSQTEPLLYIHKQTRTHKQTCICSSGEQYLRHGMGMHALACAVTEVCVGGHLTPLVLSSCQRLALFGHT